MGIKVSKPNFSRSIKKIKTLSDPDKHASKVLNKLANQTKQEIEKAHSGSMGTDMAIDKSGFSAPVTQLSDAQVTIKESKNKRSVVITGENWVFYEFGAGIHFNNPRNWSTVLETGIPSGIVPIGMYGKGQGKNPSWSFDDEKTQQRIITQGYGAVHGIANAINGNVNDVSKFVKEAFDEK